MALRRGLTVAHCQGWWYRKELVGPAEDIAEADGAAGIVGNCFEDRVGQRIEGLRGRIADIDFEWRSRRGRVRPLDIDQRLGLVVVGARAGASVKTRDTVAAGSEKLKSNVRLTTRPGSRSPR